MKLSEIPQTFQRVLTGTVTLLILALLGTGVFLAGRSRIAETIYRKRLRELCGKYEDLRRQYNEAIRRSAVAELTVNGDRLAIAYRVGGRIVKNTPLPFDPKREIYVDFVVVDGRLLIRRVFSEDTPPRAGVRLNARLLGVDWDRPDARVGKAVYRRLSEGRWVVTVTGNGALGLERLDDHAPSPPLAPEPAIRDYRTILQNVQSQTRAISLREALGACLRLSDKNS